MTAVESHNHADVTPITVGQREPNLGGETITDSNKTYLAAKGGGRGPGAEAALAKASVSSAGIDFGKASGTTNHHPGDSTSPNLNPTPSPQELMNMDMNLGEFNKVPAKLKPLASALGKDGMYGLTAEQRREVPKLHPYMDSKPESLSLDTIMSTVPNVAKPLTTKEDNDVWRSMNRTGRALENPNNVAKIRF